MFIFLESELVIIILFMIIISILIHRNVQKKKKIMEILPKYIIFIRELMTNKVSSVGYILKKIRFFVKTGISLSRFSLMLPFIILFLN